MLLDSLKSSLNQIIDILKLLSDLDKKQQKDLYINFNIGKHARHIIDHFLAVKHGISKGLIDYNQRNRGIDSEENINSAIHQLRQMVSWLDDFSLIQKDATGNDTIKIKSEIDCMQTTSLIFNSSINREFLYLINHTIHHAAHIGLICKNHKIEIPLNMGMAPCTMSFLRSG